MALKNLDIRDSLFLKLRSKESPRVRPCWSINSKDPVSNKLAWASEDTCHTHFQRSWNSSPLPNSWNWVARIALIFSGSIVTIICLPGRRNYNQPSFQSSTNLKSRSQFSIHLGEELISFMFHSTLRVSGSILFRLVLENFQPSYRFRTANSMFSWLLVFRVWPSVRGIAWLTWSTILKGKRRDWQASTWGDVFPERTSCLILKY
jgi:hypothetical protein